MISAVLQAFNKEFWIRIQGQDISVISDCKETITITRWRDSMQRSEMEKGMRGQKNADTPILTGYEVFLNYIKEHEGLTSKTSTEACGIKIEGTNKWIMLIQNADSNND